MCSSELGKWKHGAGGGGFETTQKFPILYNEGTRGQHGGGHGGVITRSRIVAVKDSI